MFEYPILSLTNGIAYGKTTQQQVTQSANICPSTTSTDWQLTGGAYLDNDGYISLPTSTSTASIDIPWNKRASLFRFGALFQSSDISASLHVSVAYLGIDKTQLNGNGWAAALSSTNDVFKLTSFGLSPAGTDVYALALASAYYVRVMVYRSAAYAKVPYRFKAPSMTLGSLTAPLEFVQGLPTPQHPTPFVNEVPAGTYQYVHQGSLFHVTLPEMHSVDSVRDSWDPVSGTFTQRVGHMTITSTSGFSYNGYDGAGVANFKKTVQNASFTDITKGIICTHLPLYGTSINVPWVRIPVADVIQIQFDVTTVARDTAALNAYLDTQAAIGTPVTVLYQLATPVVTTITPELIWEAPVFDRTQADCDAGNTKGSLNASDLNRIERNLRYLRESFDKLNYFSDFLENAEFPWNNQKLLLQRQLNNLEQTIVNMQNAFTKYPDIPPMLLTDANAIFDYAKLNLIEYSLYDLYWLLDKMLLLLPIANNAYLGDY